MAQHNFTTDTHSKKAPEPHPMSRPDHTTSMKHRLDPAFATLYSEYLGKKAPQSSDLNTRRANYSSQYRAFQSKPTGVGGIGETVVSGWSKYPGDVPLRVFVPPGENGERQVWPLHVNFHGGGFVEGDADSILCHHICANARVCCVDVAYRLQPEHPFPTPVMDSLAAVTAILNNEDTFSIDPTNVTLGGQGSGGTIALALSHLLRDTKHASAIKGVVVGQPSITNVRKCCTPETSPWSSMAENQDAPLFGWNEVKEYDSMLWMSLAGQQGFGHKEQQKDVGWFADLMSAPEFDGVAPMTFIGVAELDPLRDEALAYAERIREAGNTVITKTYPGVG